LKEWGYKTSAGQVSWRGGPSEEYRRPVERRRRKSTEKGNKNTLRREAAILFCVGVLDSQKGPKCRLE
jgi:hypothetical protein